MKYISEKLQDQNLMYKITTTNNGEEITFNVVCASDESEIEDLIQFHLDCINNPPNPPVPTYKDLRAQAYPSVPDQLDSIFHVGLDGWKATIQATKDKFPKQPA
jgi:hypothetical protein